MQIPLELAVHYGSDKPINMIFLSEGFNDGPIFASEAGEELGVKNKGWGIFESDDPDNCNIYHPNPLEVGYNAAIQGATNTGVELSFGTCNEALKQLISITPFDGEPFHKKLKGTYEPVTVEVTENSEIDLITYMDNQKMPVKINVNVEGSGDSGVPLQPATEEEMNNLLINENIGKVFLYTGETNENFTNGEYYIIEEVTE
jgi:hypothetical protein